MRRLLLLVLAGACLALTACGGAGSGSGELPDYQSEPAAQEAPAAPDDGGVVEVPDVTGMSAEEAQAEIEGGGVLTASFDPEPEDPALCEVTDQDEIGEVEAATDVVLTLHCQVDVPDTTGEG